MWVMDLKELETLSGAHAKLTKLILVNQSKAVSWELQRLTLTLREAKEWFTDPKGNNCNSEYFKEFVDPDSLTVDAREDREGVVRCNRGYL